MDSMTAYSYDWWIFLKPFNDTLLFNSYNYSNTTCKHQSKVKFILNKLGINYITVECPKGLQSLQSGIDYYNQCIASLEKLINKPRTHVAKNKERKEQIKLYKKKIELLETIINTPN